MKKLSPILLFTTAVLAACFMPINEELVSAVEDDRIPVIVVSSPEDDSIYMSEVIIEGYVKDDSQESGDNKGSLSSLSVSLSNEQSYRGRIEIDSSGGYETDTDFGNISADAFVYRSADKSFRITVDTSDYQSPIMFVTITAVDRNGNESKKTLQLQRSGGPYLELSADIAEVPGGAFFSAAGEVKIRGMLANSDTQKDKYDELSSLTLRVSPLGVNVELDIGNKVFVEEITGRPSGGETLKYNTNTMEFSCDFSLWDSEKNQVTSLTLSIVAEDRNGNTTSVDETLIKDSFNPVINTASPSIRTNYYYSENPSRNSFYPAETSGPNKGELRFSGEVRVKGTGTTLSALSLEFSKVGSGGIIKRTVPLTIPSPNDQFYRFNYFVQRGDSALRSVFNSSSGIGNKEITITLVAVDSNSLEASSKWTIKEDSEGPSFSSFLTTVNGDGTVTLGFRIQDAGSGVDFSTVTVKSYAPTTGATATDISVTKDTDTGNCSAVIAMGTDTQKRVEISAADRLGNIARKETPVLETISIASDRRPLNDVAWPGNDVTLTVGAARSRALNLEGFAATIAGVTVVSNNVVVLTSPPRGLKATVTIPSNYTTSPIPFVITGFKDGDGIPGINLPLSGTTDGSSVTLYTGGPTLTVGSEVNFDPGSVGGKDASNFAYIRTNRPFSFSVESNQPLEDFTSSSAVRITITLSGSGPIPTYITTPNLAGDKRSFTVRVTQFEGGRDGGISVSISGVKNLGDIPQSRTISGNLDARYYNGPPTLNNVSISLEKGTGNSGTDPESGDKVVLSFEVANGRVLEVDPTVTFTSNSKTLTVTKDDTATAPDYQYFHTVGNEDIGGSTPAPVEYVINFTDMAGNSGNPPRTGRSTFNLSPQ